MSTSARLVAFAAATLVLLAQLRVLEADQESKMSPSEDAHLAARAARNPELEGFKAGQAEGLVYAAIFGVVLSFSIVVGHLLACPLGWIHSTQGKNFVPRDCMRGNEKTVNYLNGCGVILGFPLYVLGYLLGHVLGPAVPPAEPVPVTPVPEDGSALGKLLVGYFTNARTDPRSGRIQILVLSDAAEVAGLERGDEVVEMGRHAVTRENLPLLIAQYRQGDVLEVAVARNGCRLRTAVALSK